VIKIRELPLYEELKMLTAQFNALMLEDTLKDFAPEEPRENTKDLRPSRDRQNLPAPRNVRKRA